VTLWLHRGAHGYFPGDKRNLDTGPCPTVLAGGNLGAEYWLEDDGREFVPDTSKPAYRVPTMDEIRAIPWNGLTVASTFSGCGGSCLGYRMAGFRVVWANEFVPAAQDSYNANKAEACYLDSRDIRTVKSEEILEQTGLARGELDLFDGSPPCQAFSTAGKREKGWGTEKKYEHGATQKNERLFDDYIRLLDGLQPKTFVAENVSGLVKGTAKGMFLEILRGLKACGYRVKCKQLDAQWLGVPQMRQRVIFVGVREDLGLEPVHPKPLQYRYSVRDAIPNALFVPYMTTGKTPVQRTADKPCPTVTTFNVSGAGDKIEVEGSHEGWYSGSLEGYATGEEWDKIKPGEASKKYFNLKRAHPDKPSGTILASHGTPGSSGVAHPTEKRKFTIPELKRICGFPDDFILKGTYAQQWERLGNSVPPVMMHKVAEAIRSGIFDK